METTRKRIKDMTVAEIITQMAPDGLQHFELEMQNRVIGGKRSPTLEIRIWDRSIMRNHILTPDSPLPERAEQIKALQRTADYHQRELNTIYADMEELRQAQVDEAEQETGTVRKVA